MPLSLRTVRTKTHTMTVDLQSGAGELYDRVNDSGEMANLFEDATHSDTRADLMAMIKSRPDDTRPVQVQVGMA